MEREDVAYKLLILGEPGSGKTTELITLAKDLHQKAIENESYPIPVILELSTWKVDLEFDLWLVEQLFKNYEISKKRAKRWLKNQKFILLLDGLDELGLKVMDKCIEAINKFLPKKYPPGIVVCCRREEYEKATVQLNKLKGAIYLKELENEQIYEYIDYLNRSSLAENLKKNSELLELARKPLFLNMLTVVYQGKPIRNYQELFSAYITTQVHDPKNQGIYPPCKNPSPEKTLSYLIWLARQLEKIKETDFLIEKIQLTWLESTYKKRIYQIIVGLIYGLIYLPIVGLIAGLIGGLIRGLICGLIGGLIGGLIRGLIYGLIYRGKENIQAAEKLRFSLKKFLSQGLICGLIGGLIGWLIGWGIGWGIGELILGLIAGLIVGLIYGLIDGLVPLEIEIKKYPNQGIYESLKNYLNVGLIVGLIYGVILGLIYGVILGLIGGIDKGGGAVIQHSVLRIILFFNEDIPWDYGRFLEHAAKHRFIQRVGGRYRFMHDLLRKHFAKMPLDLEELREFLREDEES